MLVSAARARCPGTPVTRTQQRGTEPARSDSFSYNGRNELTAATLGAAPTATATTTSATARTAREPAEELAYAANELNQYTGIEERKRLFVPTYDASGNQTLIKTSTGVWTVVYNAANRAVSFTSRNGNTIIECGYDYKGRRYMKKVTQNGTVASHGRYLYRGLFPDSRPGYAGQPERASGHCCGILWNR